MKINSKKYNSCHSVTQKSICLLVGYRNNIQRSKCRLQLLFSAFYLFLFAIFCIQNILHYFKCLTLSGHYHKNHKYNGYESIERYDFTNGHNYKSREYRIS